MQVVASLLALVEHSKYFLIFAGSYIEGSAVMMTTGLLWHLGTVAFWPAYGALLLGDITSDTMWYYIGKYGARSFFGRWGHWFGITPHVLEKVERRFHRYHTNILIISKLTMGFGLAVPVLVTAGMLRIPFSRFFAINMIGGFIWVLFLMGVGYYFGNVLALTPSQFQIALTIAMPILFFFVLRTVSARLAKLNW